MEELKRKSIRAFTWDITGTFARQGSTFIISIFLARLLEPSEFGLVGMAMVFISISQVFVDIGFTSALIQSQNNTRLTYSSVFYLNVAAGVLLTVVFFFAAPLVGSFYQNQEITVLVRWLSLIFLLNSFNLVQSAILRKELNFKVLTLRAVIASAIGGVLGVVAALLNYGVYSLVIQSLATALISTMLLWRTSTWRPDFHFSTSEVKRLTGFSSYVFFDQFVSGIFNRLDVLLIGKIFSPATLGFYTRATTLNDVITRYSASSMNKVFYPVLSSLQDNPPEYSRIYFKVVSVVAFLSFGMSGVLFVLGEDVILLLFGQKWAPSVPIFKVLILAICNYPLSVMMVNAYMSMGKSKENFYVGLFRKAVRIIPLVLAFYYDLYTFTVAVVCTGYLLLLPNIFFLDKLVGLPWKTHVQKWLEGFVPLGLLVTFCYFVPFQFTWSRLLLAFGYLTFYVTYAALLRTEGWQFIWSNTQTLGKKMLNYSSRR